MLLLVPCELLLLLRPVVLELKYPKSEFERACVKPAERSKLRDKTVKSIANGGDKKKNESELA